MKFRRLRSWANTPGSDFVGAFRVERLKAQIKFIFGSPPDPAGPGSQSRKKL